MTIEHAPGRQAVLRGRDHPRLGTYAVAVIGKSVAVGTSAGATAKRPTPTDLNEDVGAVVVGPRATLLVVADAHFGRRASELVVEHVLTTLGDDPPPADLADQQLIALFFEAGIAVERETTRPGTSDRRSRSTLAMALVTKEVVQWAAIGDSCVAVAGRDGGARLDTPRAAYLGSRFTQGDIAAALTRGRAARVDARGVVLATDGLVDCLADDRVDVSTAVADRVRDADTAGEVAESFLKHALQHRTADAVTVAVALA